jgi:DNA-binding protein HU-beta
LLENRGLKAYWPAVDSVIEQGRTQVNRKELVTAVAEQADTEQKTVDSVLRGLQDVLEKAVAKGEKVSVPGFFAVSVGRRAAREGRNPATGATIQIPAANTVKFSAGSSLKEAANS